MPFTPMMLQYFEVKDKYKDHLLFYRLGDFYEMFFDDAVIASRELELTLTGRDCGMEERAPMCGVPFHAADSYIARLVKKGYKVAICEQLENPNEAKGIVKRDVVRIITPGTVTDGEYLPEGKNNYLASVVFSDSSAALSVCDISTDEIFVTCFEGENIKKCLLDELAVYCPSEVLCNRPKEALSEVYSFITERLSGLYSDMGEEYFVMDSYSALGMQFGTEVFDDFEKDSCAAFSVCGLLRYIKDTQKCDISYIKKLLFYSGESFMGIDINSRRNLELCESMRTREKKGSLLWVLDCTKTSSGSRLMRKWIEKPLLSCNAITKRQGAVKELLQNLPERENIRELLSKTYDLERLLTKVIYRSASPKHLKTIEYTCKMLPEIKKIFSSFESEELRRIYAEFDTLDDIGQYISRIIADNDLPSFARDGGFVREGYDKDVDRLRSLINVGHSWITKLEQAERDATGIKNLKIGFNRVFGYYIEVTNSYKSLVPARYIRKQTLANAERYITEDLKHTESEIINAKEKILLLETEIFEKLCAFVSDCSARIHACAERLSLLDVYCALAETAFKNSYVCPEIDTSDVIEINDGRHPVVEKFLDKGMFVPNDAYLDSSKSLMLITGPNMAGKSTYMRQNALIVLMAQMGSFVPAKYARIGIVDKLFTRIGASDDLSSGQSTFMMEMNEVAYILKNATKKSFILYDEIGRGTSTYDGMSIARAIAEYTASSKLGAKAMFATHYHELCDLENECKNISNYSITAKKKENGLVFLRKIVKGAADESYGIEVASLAGVPSNVISRAKTHLAAIGDGQILIKTPKEQKDDNISFDDLNNNILAEALEKINPDVLTPIEALQKLYELKGLVK